MNRISRLFVVSLFLPACSSGPGDMPAELATHQVPTVADDAGTSTSPVTAPAPEASVPSQLSEAGSPIQPEAGDPVADGGPEAAVPSDPPDAGTADDKPVTVPGDDAQAPVEAAASVIMPQIGVAPCDQVNGPVGSSPAMCGDLALGVTTTTGTDPCPYTVTGPGGAVVGPTWYVNSCPASCFFGSDGTTPSQIAVFDPACQYGKGGACQTKPIVGTVRYGATCIAAAQ